MDMTPVCKLIILQMSLTLHKNCIYCTVLYTDLDWLLDFRSYLLVYTHLHACGNMRQTIQTYCVPAKEEFFWRSIQCGQNTPTYWFTAQHLLVNSSEGNL